MNKPLTISIGLAIVLAVGALLISQNGTNNSTPQVQATLPEGALAVIAEIDVALEKHVPPLKRIAGENYYYTDGFQVYEQFYNKDIGGYDAKLIRGSDAATFRTLKYPLCSGGAASYAVDKYNVYVFPGNEEARGPYIFSKYEYNEIIRKGESGFAIIHDDGSCTQTH